MQVDLVTEWEERVPFVRLYFFKRFHTLKKQHGRVSPLMFVQSTNFDTKVKAAKDSEEKNSDVIKEYQV